MLRISKLADYAVVILAAMAAGRSENGRYSAAAVAEFTCLPEPTVAKIMKLLARRGLIAATRGASGGYRLEEDPEVITMAEVIEAVDGPIALTACVESSDQCCDLSDVCAVHGRWEKVNRAVQGALEKVRLSDMMPPFASSSELPREILRGATDNLGMSKTHLGCDRNKEKL